MGHGSICLVTDFVGSRAPLLTILIGRRTAHWANGLIRTTAGIGCPAIRGAGAYSITGAGSMTRNVAGAGGRPPRGGRPGSCGDMGAVTAVGRLCRRIVTMARKTELRPTDASTTAHASLRTTISAS